MSNSENSSYNYCDPDTFWSNNFSRLIFSLMTWYIYSNINQEQIMIED